MQLLKIAWEVITPIFLMIGVGYAVQRGIGLDTKSLVRLNFWIFVPALLFVNIVHSNLSAAELFKIAIHFAILFVSMFALAWYSAKLIGAGDRLRRALTASVLFYNSGNYGLPVAQLAFPTTGIAVQAIIIMFQNITNFTVGLALHAGGREGGSRRQTLAAILKLPMVYVLIAAWSWRYTGWVLPVPLDTSLNMLAAGTVPIALIALGAQMATLRSHRWSRALSLSLVLRLCIGPMLGLLLVRLLGIHGDLAPAIVVSTSFPTAVNSALLAMEFDNEPDFAAASVFYSTLFSAITVSVVIFIVRQMQW
jgi:predicted permease